MKNADYVGIVQFLLYLPSIILQEAPEAFLQASL
jgi:hypothetical protein